MALKVSELSSDLTRKQRPGFQLDLLRPGTLGLDATVIEQHIREGQFQRSLALITAGASLLGGLEVTYEHYRGSYSQRVMYTPVFLSALLTVISFTSIFNRRVARTLLPLAALALMLDGLIGFIFHVLGIARKPGGWRLPVFNIIMGPPVLAPLLLGLSGFLGLITTFLRREDDLPGHAVRGRPTGSRLTPWGVSRQHHSVEQDIREGRFQKIMAVAAAVSIMLSGFEALYSHYKNNFKYRAQWTPILLTPLLAGAGFASIWSRTIARTLLPFASLLALLDGLIGTFYHARNIVRRPGGLKLPLYNVMYGSPILAPLLLAASGFIGLLASLLRRGEAFR